MIRPEKLKRINDTFFATKLLNINPIAAEINFGGVQFLRRIFFLMSVLNFAELAVRGRLFSYNLVFFVINKNGSAEGFVGMKNCRRMLQRKRFILRNFRRFQT